MARDGLDRPRSRPRAPVGGEQHLVRDARLERTLRKGRGVVVVQKVQEAPVAAGLDRAPLVPVRVRAPVSRVQPGQPHDRAARLYGRPLRAEELERARRLQRPARLVHDAAAVLGEDAAR